MESLNQPKINEALESALAAIDKESSHPTIEEYFPQPPTVPSSNSVNIASTISTTSQSSAMVLQSTEITLINKTDEEKCIKLQNNQHQHHLITDNVHEEAEEVEDKVAAGLLELREKSEEEISREPIYENVISSTSIIEIDVGPITAPAATAKIISLNKQKQQQQHDEQQLQQTIIPSMISNQKIQLQQQQQSDQLKHNQKHVDETNQNVSNQYKISQINSFNCCTATTSTTTTTNVAAAAATSNHNNISNNNNNKNNNNNNINNNNNKNVVDLTSAFANTTITATADAADNELTTTTTTTSAIFTTNNNNNTKNNLKSNPTMLTIEQKTPVKNATTSNSSSNNSPLEVSEPPTSVAAPPPLIESHEPYYQVPKSSEPYYDAPKHLKPVPVYENIEIFFNSSSLNGDLSSETALHMQPPKEKPPPPPIESPPLFDDIDSSCHTDTTYSSSDNTYETLSRHQQNHHHHHHNHQMHLNQDHPSPPMKRMNSTKRIKKEIRNKRSSFLGIEGSSLDDDDSYLELTVAPPPDMAQLLQEERRLDKQLYLKAALCDSSDTGESRDSGVSENHSRQSSEHYTNSSEENEPHDDSTSPLTLQTQSALLASTAGDMIYQNDGLLTVAPTPLLQTVKGNSAESWTESATVAAAATQSLTEATATANAKMMCIEEKIREQEEVLRVERELLQLEQEELKRQRENLMLRENMARRELQHGAKMLMSANRRSLQDLNGVGAMTVPSGGGNVHIEGTLMPSTNVDIYHVTQMNGYAAGQSHYQAQVSQPPTQQHHQQIYANIPNLQQQYYQMDTDYRKSMSDINEFSKRMMQPPPPVPPSKPMRAMHVNTTNTANGMMPHGIDGGVVGGLEQAEYSSRQRHALNTQHFGGSLVKIATAPTAAPRGAVPYVYSNFHHQSAQNLNTSTSNLNNVNNTNQLQQQQAVNQSLYPGNMSRNTLHALSATPKPKYTDGWVQVQQRKNYDSNLANDPAWLSAYQQKRKSMPDTYHSHSNSNNHWLVQEAEQRRLMEQQQRRVQSSSNTPVHQASNQLTNGGGVGGSALNSAATSNGKPLPDSIIQSLTERVQSKGIGDRKRNNLDKSPLHAASQYHQYNKTTQIQQQSQISQQQQQQQSSSSSNLVTTHRHTTMTSSSSNGQLNNTSNTTSQDKVLSVSGKKKCSHCGDELGRGAAMIIESLLLFYHINCFKCCVCHVQLGDGLNGTDVRVRNHKLHCQNCYSSDDGIKFSCV